MCYRVVILAFFFLFPGLFAYNNNKEIYKINYYFYDL